jgi:hypothetical protein
MFQRRQLKIGHILQKTCEGRRSSPKHPRVDDKKKKKTGENNGEKMSRNLGDGRRELQEKSGRERGEGIFERVSVLPRYLFIDRFKGKEDCVTL